MKRTYLLLTALLLGSLTGFSQVFITELADPNDNASCRYVELYNAGGSDIDLSSGWALQRFTNDNVDPQSPVSLTGTIPSGGYYIVATSSADFSNCFGFTPDQEIGTGGPADGNGDDNLQLLDPSSAVVDIFGVPGEDGSGTCHEYEDGRAERAASVTSGNNGVWNEANWNVWADSEVLGCTNHTTGEQNVVGGLFDPGSWIGGAVSSDTQVAFSSFSQSISEDGGTVDVCVSISNPDDVSATTVDLNIDGLSTAINGSDFSTITFPVTLTFPAGDATEQCLSIQVLDDSDVEGDEDLVLNLENVSGGNNASIGVPNQTALTIVDNDFASTVDAVITEIMYNTSGVDDEWVELCTNSNEDQDLSGYTINVGGSPEFTFPEGTVLSSQTCLTVSLGSDGDGNYNNTCPFTPDLGIDALTDNSNNLVNSSETISLIAPDGVSVADEVTYSDTNGADGNGSSLHLIDITADNSSTSSNWQEVPDGGSPGANSLDSPCTTSETILSFVGSSAVATESDGTVEICISIENADPVNETTVEVVLGGVNTADNGSDYDDGSGSPLSFPILVNFPAGDVANQCISVNIIDDGDLEDNEILSLSLQNASGGNNAILGANTDFELTIVDNDAEPVDADIVINEIHYNPCSDQGNDGDFEFIELYNNGSETVDLTGWTISNAVDLSFGEAFIAAGEYIVLAVNPLSYEGNGYQVFSLSGSVNNTGETIVLSDALTNVVDEVTYSDSNPWPNADGNCSSLELIDADTDNSDPANWQASFVANGTPGMANSTAPDATAYTIVQLQSEDHSSEYVSTSGVVTGVFGSSFTIQDGTGVYTGIWVEGNGVAQGDDITVEGTVQEVDGLTTIMAVNVVVNSSGNALPAAETLSTVQVSDEPYEGVLIQVTGGVAQEDLGFGEWSVDDGTGEAIIDDLGFNAQPVTLGDTYQVTGPLYFSFGSFKITPRGEEDVAKLGCTNESATNYDPSADIDDGSCEFDGDIPGCTYSEADNYDPTATVDDGTCEFTSLGGCPTDLDNNGITGASDLLILLGNFGAVCTE